MCGIAGLVIKNSELDPGVVVRDMTEVITYRGPDDYGLACFSTGASGWRAGRGHRRLAIIDPEGGHQPMANGDQSVCLVCNGEIYNYVELRTELSRRGCVFTSASDTEVLLRAYETYGERCIEYFRGMFAFAVWDKTTSSLFLARDRFGEKPLYFYHDSETFAFASEIKALLAVPGLARELNRDAIYNYLLYRYVPAPETLFREVYKLLPGTTARWQDGRLTIARYFSPPDRYPQQKPPPDGHPVDTFFQLLEESVRLRMRSDVPFGAFLSGGIDSSAIVALMSRCGGPPVKTFSIGFAEAGYSEAGYARRIAALFRTEHRELEVTANDMMGKLPELIRFRDAPVSEPSDIPIHLLAGFARREVKMVLTGEGGDEIFGGYPKHVFERYAGVAQFLPSVCFSLANCLADALPYRFHRVKTALRSSCIAEFTDRMPRWFGTCSPEELRCLVAGNLDKPARLKYFHFDVPDHMSRLRKVLFFDQSSWLPDNLLERGDRMTMACSLEARLPFLDHELAAYVSSLPDHFRVRGLRTKWILRQAMRPLLPKQIIERPKIGFKVPVNIWFQTSMKDYLFDLLTGTDSRIRDYFPLTSLRKILTSHIRKRENNEKFLWTLLNLELWHRHYAP